MNSWTRCFIAALALAGVGALWLSLVSPLPRSEIAASEPAASKSAPAVVATEPDDRGMRRASTN